MFGNNKIFAKKPYYCYIRNEFNKAVVRLFS
ncbi:hypothetical protein BE25_0165 [Staphylococcus phage vB_SepM_BE25]|nr:hypothetical protein BE24_0134 [Staphylococcus phage vB_SepM_BE24]WEU70651.1 hypothetical protein BE25_0165 [Staphylococcus phage vB_SepM_BE25]